MEFTDVPSSSLMAFSRFTASAAINYAPARTITPPSSPWPSSDVINITELSSNRPPPSLSSLLETTKVEPWFYVMLSVTGLVIAVPNGIIVALAVKILLRKKRGGAGAGRMLKGLKAQYCYIASLAGSDMLVGLVTSVIFMTRVQDNILLCHVKIGELYSLHIESYKLLM
jgi:hypothetical protein